MGRPNHHDAGFAALVKSPCYEATATTMTQSVTKSLCESAMPNSEIAKFTNAKSKPPQQPCLRALRAPLNHHVDKLTMSAGSYQIHQCQIVGIHKGRNERNKTCRQGTAQVGHNFNAKLLGGRQLREGLLQVMTDTN
eukprot:362831-Chlamydomonas_euryale.AAC.1